jgi:predicted DNA-binding transcriptional regulator AlpA
MNAPTLEALLDELAEAVATRVAKRLAGQQLASEASRELKPDFITEIEAARRTGLSRRTLQGWRGTGRGPRWVKVGRSVRYPLPDLEEFMASR